MKITALNPLSAAPASGDLVAIVDVSDTSMAASGSTKKITATNLLAGVLPLAGGTLTGNLTLGTNVLSAGGLSVGTTPAAAGALRLSNAAWVASRNAVNNADVNIIRVNSSDEIEINGPISIPSGPSPFANNGPKLYVRNDWTGTETSSNRNVINVYSQAKGAWNPQHFLYQYESRWVDHTSVNSVNVTGTASSGGLIRITTGTAHGYATGDRIIMDAVGGTTEANGTWIITVIDTTHFDLQGSTFTNAWTSGGTASNRAGGAVILGLVAPQIRRGGYASATNAHADDVAVFFGGNNGTRKATDLIYGGHTTFDDIGGTFLDEVEFDTCGSFDNTATYGLLLNGLGTGQSVRASHYGSTAVPEFQGRMARGIFDAPLRTKSADVMLRLAAVPAVAASDVAAASFAGATARIDMIANEDQTVSAQGSRIVFYTTPIGSTTINEKFRIPNTDGIDFSSGTFTTYSIRFKDGGNSNITFGTSTGTKIGTGTTEKIGIWNATPVARPSAYTQTYSTADKTLATQTSAALTNANGTGDTTIADVGTSFSQTTLNNNFRDLSDQHNALRTDLLDLAQFVNAIVDDLQTIGWFA